MVNKWDLIHTTASFPGVMFITSSYFLKYWKLCESRIFADRIILCYSHIYFEVFACTAYVANRY